MKRVTMFIATAFICMNIFPLNILADDVNPCLSGVFIIGHGKYLGIIEMVGCEEWEALSNESSDSIMLEDEDGDGKYIIPSALNDDNLDICHYIYWIPESGNDPIYVVDFPGGLQQRMQMSEATWQKIGITFMTDDGPILHQQEGAIWKTNSHIDGTCWAIY